MLDLYIANYSVDNDEIPVVSCSSCVESILPNVLQFNLLEKFVATPLDVTVVY